ncbi:MAG TPA: hypothetical protein VGH58_01355 [Solirubrobacterales bacterium]
MLIVSGVLASSASASPARYIYEACDSTLPGGGVPAGTKFVVNPGVAMAGGNSCASAGGTLSITETGQTNSTYSYWSVPIDADPGGYVESLTISGAACGLGPGNDHTFVYEQGWPTCVESQRIFHVNTAPSPIFSGAGFSILMNCDGNYAPGCGAGPWIAAHYFAATEVDPNPPAVPKLAGTLLAGGVIRGHQELSVEASDEGGGLSKVATLVNGLPAGQPNVANCDLAQTKNSSVVGTVAASPTPCPANLKPSWLLDTAAYPFQNGANSVQVCASDFATVGDPNTTCTASQTVDVDNSCTESKVVGGETLSAQFAGSHREEITVPYDHTAKITGELADNAGDAISGATICVQMQTLGTSRGLVPVATTTTDAHGHFTYDVAPGPNRRVLLGYRHDTFQVARSVRYYAHAKPTLRITPSEVGGGDQVRISGKVPGPRAAGRVVVLQASALGSPHWYTFHRATANRHGVFHSRYRFDATTRTTTYRIRVVIPRQGGYPWENGHSKPAVVEVRVGK